MTLSKNEFGHINIKYLQYLVMYCILQIDENNTESVIGFLKNSGKFKSKIVKLISNEYGHRLMDQVSFEQIRDNTCFQRGNYLLNNDFEIQLVAKEIMRTRGFCYNCEKYSTRSIFLWKLVPYGNVINKNANVCQKKMVVTDTYPKNKQSLEVFINSDKIKIEKISDETDENPSTEIFIREEYNVTEIDLPEFKIDSMVEYANTFIVGKRGTGKTYLIRDIISNISELDKLLIFDPNCMHDSFYRDNFPNATVEMKYSEEVVENFLNECKMKINENGGKPDKPSCIVFDCYIDGPHKSDLLKEIFLNGRHYGINVINAQQTCLGYSPALRLNFDYIFMCREGSNINVKKLWNNFGGMFSTQESFRKHLDMATVEYGKMVINNTSATLDNNVFIYRSELLD